jgi:hypothetical protein
MIPMRLTEKLTADPSQRRIWVCLWNMAVLHIIAPWKRQAYFQGAASQRCIKKPRFNIKKIRNLSDSDKSGFGKHLSPR